MFKQLNIMNFQSWKEASFKFSPGINLIVGKSDHGKSAIMRSIEKVVFNRPLGTAFVNWDDPNNIAEITLTTEKHEVTRYIGKGVNTYGLHELGTDEELELDPVDTKVPEDVKKVLNVTALNMHKQRDAFFLLGKRPGEIGRYLNTIVNLEVIDTSLTHAAKRVKTAEKDKEYTEQEVSELEQKYQNSAWLAAADKELTKLEQLSGEIRKSKEKIVSLGLLRNKIKKDQSKLSELKKTTRYKNRVQALLDKDKEIDELNSKVERVEKLVQSIKMEKEILSKAQSIIALKDEYIILISLSDGIEKADKKGEALNTLLVSIEEKQSEKGELSIQIEKDKKEFDSLMPDVCPLCNQEYVLT